VSRTQQIAAAIGASLLVAAVFALFGNDVGLGALVVGALFLLYASRRNQESMRQLAPTLKEMCETREAQAKAETAEIERATAQIRHRQTAAEWEKLERSQKTDEYYRQIKELAETERAKSGGGIRTPLEPTAAPGEDPELVKEAWLRYKREIEETFNRNWRR
jgi:hypothetical protein